MAQADRATFRRQQTNALYYGDNLYILREFIGTESIDLVYLDPPFSSNRAYNVIFKDESGRRSDAQLLAFEDTWHWGPTAEATYRYLTNTAEHAGRVPEQVGTLVAALVAGIGKNQLLAYLVEMAARLTELHRTLRPTGSLYLHCDPTASHYLKLLLDSIFGPQQFRNEIVWKRTTAHSDAKQGATHYGRVHDTLLFYAKSDEATFTPQWFPYDDEYVLSHYRHVEEGTGRRYRKGDLTASKPGGDTRYEWKGVRPYTGRYWAYSRAKMEEFERQGRLVYTRTGMPEYKRYLDEMPGRPAQDVWDDIPPINSQAKERLGWDTQKPLALLERVVQTSSNPGDVVLDPFCGCGTAVVAAQKLGRRWIGIDVTYLAIAVVRARLKDAFGLTEVEVINQPTEVEGARQLALSGPEGRYQFQWWALTRINATPLGGVQKKGADRGIDGKITFTDENGKLETVLVSVKSGQVQSSDVRDLRGTVEREGAAMGVLVTLEAPSGPMRTEAAKAGLYHSNLWNRDYARLQIITVRELLQEGRKPDIPPFALPAFRQAQPVPPAPTSRQPTLFG